jgi:hypothetical protein
MPSAAPFSTDFRNGTRLALARDTNPNAAMPIVFHKWKLLAANGRKEALSLMWVCVLQLVFNTTKGRNWRIIWNVNIHCWCNKLSMSSFSCREFLSCTCLDIRKLQSDRLQVWSGHALTLGRDLIQQRLCLASNHEYIRLQRTYGAFNNLMKS